MGRGDRRQRPEQQQRKIVSIPSSASTHDVYEAAMTVFDCRKEIVALRFGFPPKILENNTNIAVHTVLSNNERIQVEFATTAAVIPSSADLGRKNSPTQHLSTASKPNSAPFYHSINSATESSIADEPQKRQSSQRAAARAATAGFAASIKAQDNLLSSGRQVLENTKRGKRQRTTHHSKPSENNNNQGEKPSPMTRPNSHYFDQTSLEGGRRLADGEEVVSSRRANVAANQRHVHNKLKAKSLSSTWKTEEDISVALLSALNQSGGGSGKVGSILRKAMSNAVTQSYEASRALVRVAAIVGHSYAMTIECSTATSHDKPPNSNNSTAVTQPQPEKIHVVYAKGVEGRGQLDETVDFIPNETLLAVLAAIHQSNPEALRPTRLAQLSPRVLWSLVYHTSRPANTTHESLPSLSLCSVEEALEKSLPHLDWSYLKARKRTLSEKAKENLRQKLEQEKCASCCYDDNPEENLLQAQVTILAVQNAMETMHDWDSQQRRRRLARAAMARVDESLASDLRWSLVTPIETDDEELLACIQPTAAAFLGIKEEKDDDKIDIRMEVIVKSLIRDCGIHNWRELANASVPNLVQRLNTVLAASDLTAMQFALQDVENWVDYAQQESVEEIMVELCDGRFDVVERLRDKANTGTPKDLAGWRHVSHLLWNETCLDQVTPPVTIETLTTWCQRASYALKEWEWLERYVTPIG